MKKIKKFYKIFCEKTTKKCHAKYPITTISKKDPLFWWTKSYVKTLKIGSKMSKKVTKNFTN